MIMLSERLTLNFTCSRPQHKQANKQTNKQTNKQRVRSDSHCKENTKKTGQAQTRTFARE